MAKISSTLAEDLRSINGMTFILNDNSDYCNENVSEEEFTYYTEWD